MASAIHSGAQRETESGRAGEGETKTVLVVDDDRAFCLALSDGITLFEGPLDVLTAANGKEAVEIMGRSDVDLVITDLRMPEMDGMELVRWVNEKRAGTPVIVMSAFASAATIADLEKRGYRFFDKPLDLTELTDAVHTLLTA